LSDFGLAGEIPVTSRFIFEVDGVDVATFNEIDGLEMRVEVVTYTEGGQNGFVHQLPGRASWPTLVMRKGTISNDDALWNWISTTTGEGFGANENKLERKTAAITVMSGTGQRLRAWELLGAWPCYWRLTPLNAETNAPIGEEIHIKHHGFKPKNVGT
jgi:phage tail-like protein